MRTFATVVLMSVLVCGCSRPPLPKTESGSSSAGASAMAKHGTGDAALKAKVKAALANDVGLKTLNIGVDSNGGVVTLKGQVDTLDTKQRAQAAAQSVRGVTWVQNQLSIAPKAEPSAPPKAPG